MPVLSLFPSRDAVRMAAMDVDCGYNDVGDNTASSSPSLMTATTMMWTETITLL